MIKPHRGSGPEFIENLLESQARHGGSKRHTPEQTLHRDTRVGMVIKIQNYIGGQFKDPSSSKWIESLNPATGNTNNLVPDSKSDDLNDAVEAANAAFKSWSTTTRQERSDILMKVATLLEEQLDEFAHAESADQGKPISLAKTVDIPR